MKSRYSNTTRNFGDISHQAAVVIQCHQDKRDIVERVKIANGNHKNDYHIHMSTPTSDNTIVRIDRGDPVFSIGTSTVPKGNMLNNAPPVSSNLNHICIRKQQQNYGLRLSEIETNLKIAEGIRFMGISLGATDPIPDHGVDGMHTKSQITVRTQGTMTVFNNGSTNFVPGDTIIWTIPTEAEVKEQKKRFGRNNAKILLKYDTVKSYYTSYDRCIEKFLKNNTYEEERKMVNTVVDLFALEIKKQHVYTLYIALSDTKNSFNWEQVWNEFDFTTSTRAKPNTLLHTFCELIRQKLEIMSQENHLSTMVTMTLKAYMKVQSDIERRKVGKCLNFSKPGQGADLLLGAS